MESTAIDVAEHRPVSNTQVLRNVVMTYVVGAGNLLLGLVFFPYFTSRVGVEAYGVWLLLSSMTSYFVQDLGMSGSIVKYSADARARADVDELSRISTTGLAFFVALGVAAACAYSGTLLFAWGPLNIAEPLRATALQLAGLVAVVGLLIGTPLQAFSLMLGGAQRQDIERTFAAIGLGARVVMTIAVVYTGWGGVVGIAAAELTGLLIPGVLSLSYVMTRMPEIRIAWRFMDFHLFRLMLPFSLKLFLMSLFALIILQTDNLVISLVLSAGMVTFFAAGFRIYQAVRMLVGYLAAPFLARSSELHALDAGKALRRTFLLASKYAVAVSTLVGVPVLLLVDPFVRLWLGPEFMVSVSIARVLTASFLLNAFHLVANTMFAGVGKPGRYLILHALWASSNLVLSVILARHYGLIGVALGTAIPIVILEPFYVRAACREFRITFRQFVHGIVMSPWLSALCAATPIIALLVWWPGMFGSWAGLLLAAGMYVVVYLGVFWWIGVDDDGRAQALDLVRTTLYRRSRRAPVQ